MKLAFIGVSHWHTRHYLGSLVGARVADVVGVADPNLAVARKWAEQVGARAFEDYREMCEATHPELVFALGRHCDMAAEAEYLIDAELPFAIEKPCGVNVAEIARIEALARKKRAYVSVPFTYRSSLFRRLIEQFSPGRELVYGTFRQIPGPVQRYRDWGVEWTFDPKLAGGGCTLNLSIHHFDLVRVLAPSASWQVAAATMSAGLSSIGVEDYSATLLEAGDRRATIVTGYATPTPFVDTVLSVSMSDGNYFRWDGDGKKIVVTLADGQRHEFVSGVSQRAYYPQFVLDTLEQVAAGRSPDAGLSDMLAAARLAEGAYRAAGFTNSMS